MRFLLDTNVLIPLEDSRLPLSESLANFVRLANANGHELLYHPASEVDVGQDQNEERRRSTLHRLRRYTKLDIGFSPDWRGPELSDNDAIDHEILYAVHCNAVHGLVTEDRIIHAKAKKVGIGNSVYTIQTAEDLLQRLHTRCPVWLPNIEEVPLHSLTSDLGADIFDSLREGYPEFNSWFIKKSQEGRSAWISRTLEGELAGLCIFAHQKNEQITENCVLPGEALKLSTFKVGERFRGRKIGELFLKVAFSYAQQNRLEHIFLHGDTEQHQFLFNLLEDFGFTKVGYHPGRTKRDFVYLKNHPTAPPEESLEPLEYVRQYYPHFKKDESIDKYIIPIRPVYHNALFPSLNAQTDLLQHLNTTGNPIKMAYLCHAQTESIQPGSLVLFYRSADDQSVTSLGVVESYQTSSDENEIISMVKRRTVYSMDEIKEMAQKPTRVMLFRIVKHFTRPVSRTWMEQKGVLNGPPQSIVKIGHTDFDGILEYAG